MKRNIIVALLFFIIIAAIIFINTNKLDSSDGLEAYFTPVQESLPEVTIPQPTTTSQSMKDLVGSSIQNASFVDFVAPHILNSECILQMPDYPTGCEIVSLTMALRYVTKEEVLTDDLIDNYLEFAENNFTEGFIGDPREYSGAGCFPPVVAKCANNYFRRNGYTMKAMDVTGSTVEDLYYYIDHGLPVVIWSTMDMGQPIISENVARYDGKSYPWYYDEHCVMLKGYNEERNVFIINDPLEGEVERDIDEFMKIFDYIGNMAVIIA